MSIEPFYLGGERETVEGKLEGGILVKELSPTSLHAILKEGKQLQAEICDLPLDGRLQVISMLGEVWQQRMMDGELDSVKKELAAATGYPEKLIELEFSLVKKVLDAEEILANLDGSLVGGAEALESYVELRKGEGIRHLPAGPTFIISSGNSVIPTIIPTIISLVSGNFTLLKPSISNYRAVVEVFSGLEGLMGKSPAAHLMARSLAISYMGHNSPTMEEALGQGDFGVVNFWGGEPARSEIGQKLSKNPHHPRLFVNGPLTGIAVIGGARADDSAAKGLALNMILYEQQLCSSPTLAFYIGSYEESLRFAAKVRDHLDSIGSQYPVEASNDALFVRNSAQKVLMFHGSKVLSSTSLKNPWTLAVSRRTSNLEAAVESFPSFNVHGRRRFLEMVVVDSTDGLARFVEHLPSMKAFRGVDKVQTVGTALPEELRREVLWSLAPSGVYRFVPVEDMFMRSATEPYDGMPLASLFTYAVYQRQMPTKEEMA
jgi:hypothetical protein